MDRDDQTTRAPFGTGDDTLRASVAARIADIMGTPTAAPTPSATTVPAPFPASPLTAQLASSPVDAAGAETIDVRTYLLDPPASADEVARSERRARIVRIGSLAGCAVLAVVLLVPMPGGRATSTPSTEPRAGSDDRTAPTAGAAEPAPAGATPSPAPSLPRRVDTTRTARAPVKRIDTRPASAPRARTPTRVTPRQAQPSSAPSTAVATKPAVTPIVAPKPTPPVTSTPTPKPTVPGVSTSGADAVLVPLG